ncbi:hypothetical protein DPMN_190993 [Dreissena polymorpha]|uniref:Uncharacterized protein n=1 Tax=Dreissena polymorpha TaxID=45954 RepID=A0A9D3Y3I8_DREPO|nr:hypothetical protein DPMN_190993 [Dreissena polymorpha]
MQIEEVDEAEDQEKYTSKGVNQSQKGENHIGKGDHLTNAGNVNGLNEAKKPARRMKIEEVEDDDDKNNEIENHGERNKLNGNAETRFECTEYTIANNNSQRAKDIWNEDEVTKSNDNAITGVPIVEQELVASDMAINKSNSAHQMANGSVEMTNGEQKTESNQRSGSPVEIKPDINMSETFDSESKENKDSVLADNGVNDDDSKTPEVQSDKTEDNDVDEFADNEGVENDKKAKPEPVVQHVKRPVFYMTDYPLDCLNLKEEATTLFRSGQYGDAAKVYGNIIDILEKGIGQYLSDLLGELSFIHVCKVLVTD